jgi:uncharacterized protein YcbX
MPGNGPLRLTRIRIYPLKGAAGFDLQESGMDQFGLPGDRRWMLATPSGRFLSQRTHPRLCLIRTAPLNSEPGKVHMEFSLEAPGMGSFQLGPPPAEERIEVQVHKDRFHAVGGSPDGDRWFSEFLREPCRLVFLPEEVLRPVDPAWAPGHRVSLADGYPIHLTTEESLEEMNGWLPERTNMLRYRPNLVVAGGAPWEEDEWRVIEIGDITLHLVKPCARCPVITVDQGTGTRGREPLRRLRAFREWEGKVYFGQNAVFQGNGRFRVGGDVRILEKGPRRPPLQWETNQARPGTEGQETQGLET